MMAIKRRFYKIIRGVILKSLSEKYGKADFKSLREILLKAFSEQYGTEDYAQLRNILYTMFSEQYGIGDYRKLRMFILNLFSKNYAIEDYPAIAEMLADIIPMLRDKSVMQGFVEEVYPEIRLLKSSGRHLFMDNYSNVNKGENVKIYSPCHVSDASVGDYTYIAQNSYISMTTIGKFCSIGPNLLCGWGIHPLNGISTHPMFFSTFKQNGMTLSSEDKVEERKCISIGNDVFIGANVTILDGITIGDGAVIGAGAVVSKDIPPYSIAVGCPIKIINYRFSEDVCKKLRKIKWWDFDVEKLKDVEANIFNVNDFIKEYTEL